MKIIYSILTHNETDSLLKLIEFIVKHKDEEDEIVILDDYSDNERTKEILDTMSRQAQLERKQAEADAMQQQMNKIPLKIYIG